MWLYFPPKEWLVESQPAPGANYSTFSGVCVHVRTLFIVRRRIVAIILLSIPSIWSSRSMSSLVYCLSRDRSQSHQPETMMMVMGIVMTK